MKYIIILFTILAFNANAGNPDMSGVNNPNNINWTNYNSYKVPEDQFYGRNKKENVGQALTATTVTKSNNLTKSVNKTEDPRISAQVETLETTVGELVQKVEDDRLRKMEDLDSKANNTKDTLKDNYEVVKNLEVNNLGYEIDPSVKDAFKCQNIDPASCEPNLGDPNDIRECNDNQMIRWDGNNWTCIGLF